MEQQNRPSAVPKVFESVSGIESFHIDSIRKLEIPVKNLTEFMMQKMCTGGRWKLSKEFEGLDGPDGRDEKFLDDALALCTTHILRKSGAMLSNKYTSAQMPPGLRNESTIGDTVNAICFENFLPSAEAHARMSNTIADYERNRSPGLDKNKPSGWIQDVYKHDLCTEVCGDAGPERTQVLITTIAHAAAADVQVFVLDCSNCFHAPALRKALQVAVVHWAETEVGAAWVRNELTDRQQQQDAPGAAEGDSSHKSMRTVVLNTKLLQACAAVHLEKCFSLSHAHAALARVRTHVAKAVSPRSRTLVVVECLHDLLCGAAESPLPLSVGSKPVPSASKDFETAPAQFLTHMRSLCGLGGVAVVAGTLLVAADGDPEDRLWRDSLPDWSRRLSRPEHSQSSCRFLRKRMLALHSLRGAFDRLCYVAEAVITDGRGISEDRASLTGGCSWDQDFAVATRRPVLELELAGTAPLS